MKLKLHLLILTYVLYSTLLYSRVECKVRGEKLGDGGLSDGGGAEGGGR